jgi:hypothetical protein
MGYRGSQLDVAKPFTPNLGLDYLNTAFFTNDSTVLHSLVLAAVTFIILNRPEDLGTEETVPFRFKGPVIDGLRFFHLSMRPVTDLARRSKRYTYSIETQRFLGFGKKAKQFFHVSTYLFVVNGKKPFIISLSFTLFIQQFNVQA